MRLSFRLVTVRGIPIVMHWSFTLILVLLGGYYAMNTGWFAALKAVAFLLMLFSLVVLHELAHSLVAQRFGMVVREIILLPIGGMAVMERIPEEPGKEAAIAVAGPAFNLAVALALFGLMWWLPGVIFDIYDLEANESAFTWGAVALFQANVMLFVFNLIPAFPMDGGRLLRAALVKTRRLSYARATSAAVNASRVLLAIMVVFGIMRMNPFLVLIPLVLFTSANAEEQSVRQRASIKALTASHLLPQKVLCLGTRSRLGDVITVLLGSGQRHFPVMRGRAVLGIVSLDAVRRGLDSPSGAETPVTQVMQDPLVVGPEAPLVEVQRTLEARNAQAAVIMHRGRLAGLLTRDALARLSSMLSPGGE